MNPFKTGKKVILPSIAPSAREEKKNVQSKQPPKIDIVKQGVTSVELNKYSAFKPGKPAVRPQGAPLTQSGIEVPKKSKIIEVVKSYIPPPEPVSDPMVKEREMAVNRLFSCLRPYYEGHNLGLLEQDLQKGLSGFNKGDHSFVCRDHIVFVSKPKPNDPIAMGAVPLGKKQYFETGGFAKIYALQWFEPDMEPGVLKLSKKKLKPFDELGNKIALTPEEREEALKKGTPAGLSAKDGIEKEIKMMHFIRENAPNLTGLNVNVWAKVTFGHQAGYFTKQYVCDGQGFITRHQPPAESRFEFMEQVMQGLETLHGEELDCVHRDIKLPNILVKENGRTITLGDGSAFPSCDADISDFGNTVRFTDLFPNDHPSASEVIGSATPSTVSDRFFREIEAALESIKDAEPDTEVYAAGKSFINARLRENDRFALGLALYSLWTGKDPDFVTYRENWLMELTREDLSKKTPNLNAKLKQMEEEILSASHAVSSDKLHDANAVANTIINMIRPGLVREIRTVGTVGTSNSTESLESRSASRSSSTGSRSASRSSSSDLDSRSASRSSSSDSRSASRSSSSGSGRASRRSSTGSRRASRSSSL